MQFNSLSFLIFFPAVCLCYYVIPQRFQSLFLLGASYYFYLCWDVRYALLLLAVTVFTYVLALGMQTGQTNGETGVETAGEVRRRPAAGRKQRRWRCLAAVGGLFFLLFFFKYYGFALQSLQRALELFHCSVPLGAPDLVLPAGISFYSFQAIGYIVDVYREKIPPERNFFRYALFLSFFPQLISGPIGRGGELLAQLKEKHRFSFEQVRGALLQMLYGYFQKIVLSEYLASVVNSVYNTYAQRSGFQLTVATVCYAFQIYCDFDGYSNIAIGAAKVMGIRLGKNFEAPYFSRSVSEFWRRWHISLSSWFRDYLYIPLGGSRRGKVRKWRNLMLVFLLSGLWHGASWHYVVWGAINGAYQILGEWLRPLRVRVRRFCRVREGTRIHHFFQTLLTFILIDISWIFFRAGSRQGLAILKKILTIAPGWYTAGENLAAFSLSMPTLLLLLVCLLILICMDWCRRRGIHVSRWVCSRPLPLRWLIYYGAIFGVLIFGVYGPGYDASQFIYFQF